MNEPVSIESVIKSSQGFAVQLFETKGEGKTGLWSNDANTDPTAIAFQGLQVDEAAMVKLVSIGPQAALMQLSETGGAAAPMRRQFETLLQSSDSRSDLTLLVAPSFLFGNGRELFSRQANLYDLLRSSIDESMQAVQLSTSSQSQWYIELRMLSSETKDAGKFASQIKQSLLKAPDELEAGMNKNPVHPYWRALAGRYPQMLRSLNKYGRFGIEDGQVVANVYLPIQAIDNMLISSWMALQNLKSDSGSANSGSRITPAVAAQKSIEEILDTNVSISFAQESLESALQLIATEVSDSLLGGKPISMAINGSAFQKEGITRNQQIRDFAKPGVPLRSILMDLVRRANPVTTVKEPTEKDQKVVWIILDDPESILKKKIELTTRRWVEENKATLPKEFVGN
jgi:hypothetical protein